MTNSEVPNANTDSIAYNTRASTVTENDLFVHPVSLNISPENPLIAIARIFNHLPREIKHIKDEKLFARKLKKC